MDFSADADYHGTVAITLIVRDGPTMTVDKRGRTDEVTLDVSIDRGAIYGVKWNDENKDGVKQDGEFGVEGVRIFVDENGDGQYTDGERETWTDANGQYAFRALTADTYFVAEDTPDNAFPTYPPALPNGGFEAKALTPWKMLADVRIVPNLGSVQPTEGSRQAVITNEPDVPIEDLFEFLRVTGTEPWLPPIQGISGSALMRTVTVDPGATLSFDWMFLTAEELNNTKSNDFAMFIVPELNYAAVISDTFFTPEPGGIGPFPWHTGYESSTCTFEEGGRYTIGLAVLDVGNDRNPSALLVDNFQLAGGIGVHEVKTSLGAVVDDIDIGNLTVAHIDLPGGPFGHTFREGDSLQLIGNAKDPNPDDGSNLSFLWNVSTGGAEEE